ncbi:MAG: hypothetical protein MJA27_36250 [Pseudanabaenales cyanobacterium]|nr:hypothetical protein [Pseudanabaenales cyanobacterium]
MTGAAVTKRDSTIPSVANGWGSAFISADGGVARFAGAATWACAVDVPPDVPPGRSTQYRWRMKGLVGRLIRRGLELAAR